MTPDRLNKHLLDIEDALGGTGELPPAYLEDKLHWHLCKIEELINGGGGRTVSFVIVDKLPETGEKNVIYFVPKKTIFSKNKYDEYVWIENEWEYIGTGTIDPTGYATIEYVDAELLKKQDKLTFNIEEIPVTAQTLTSIKDGDEVYVIPHSGATVEWSDIANKPDFQEVSFTADYDDLVNKPDLTIYAEKEDLADVATSGDYEDLINKPDIPENTSDLNNDSGFITDSALDGYATEAFVEGYHDSTKQNTINDLADIKAGAALGATAVQPAAISDMATKTWVGEQDYLTKVSWADIDDKPTFATVATSGSYNDLINKPTIPVVPTNVSAFNNDAGYITSAALSGYATESYVQSYHDATKQDVISDLSTIRSGAALGATAVQPAAISDMATETWVGQQGYLTSVSWSDVSGKPTFATVATSGDYDDLINKPDLSIYAESSSLAAVATSGDYDDLLNKPTIPAAQVNSDWDAVSGVAQILNKPVLATVATSGSYNDLSNKPDLFDGDYDSLINKPDLTVYEEKDNLKDCAYMDENELEINYNQLTNTPSIPENTSDLTNDSGFITADYHDSTKQDTLVSGTNIKTVDGNSLLGSGNINTKEKYTVNLLVDMDTGKVTMSQEDIDYLYSVKPSDCYVISPNPTLGSVKQIYELVGYVEVGSEKQLVYKTLDTFDSDYLGNTLVAIPKSSSDTITPVEQELAKYSDIPTKTSDLTNDGDGAAQNDPYAKISDITTPTFTATTFNPDSAITFSQEDLAGMYENQYDIIKVVAEILPNVFFNLSFRKTADTEASGLTSVKYDYTTCTNNDTLEEIGFQVFKNNDTYSTTPYHLQLQNSPVTDVQTSDGTSIVSNKIATLPAVYAHHIYLKGASDDKTNLYCTLITNFSTAFDLDSFFAYVYNLGATGAISATGTVVYSVVGTTENCRAAAAIKAGSTAKKLILVYHGTGDAGISTIEVGKAGANVDLNTIADSVIKVI